MTPIEQKMLADVIAAAREAFNVYAAVDKGQQPSDILIQKQLPLGWAAFSDLQVRLARWETTHFNSCEPWKFALGVGEEAGELLGAVLKSYTKIRNHADRVFSEAKIADAIGDCAIYLMQLSTIYRLDFGTLVFGIAMIVTRRDWTRWPLTGHPPEPETKPAPTEEAAS